MVLADDGIRVPLAEAGIEIVEPEQGAGSVSAVMVGYTRNLTSDALEAIIGAVWDGAEHFGRAAWGLVQVLYCRHPRRAGALTIGVTTDAYDLAAFESRPEAERAHVVLDALSGFAGQPWIGEN